MTKTIGAALFLVAFTTPALAFDPWPCEVLLCMANPAGPTAASACVPPITRLWREMSRRGFRMPACQQVSYSDNAKMIADITRTLQNNPSASTSDIDRGMTQAAISTALSGSVARWEIMNSPFDPCEGGRTQVINRDDEGRMTSECRGPQIGWTTDRGEDMPVYEGYMQSEYGQAGYAVYINNQLWQIVRPGSNGHGVTYYGTGGAGRFPPPPAESGSQAYFQNVSDMPAYAVQNRSEATTPLPQFAAR